MRMVPARNVLPLIGIAALVLVAATGSTLAKKPRTSASAETARSAHYSARDWKRRYRAYTTSRWPIRPHGYARVYYHRPIYPWDSYETDLLFDCLLYQPFVTCP